ncbi:methyltransferase domain-containing protein [Candidatus Sumerlaeota bacterium]|nr:methyltransferase domain-containing protein [Candidatus Sumerlaeota bacterium]
MAKTDVQASSNVQNHRNGPQPKTAQPQKQQKASQAQKARTTELLKTIGPVDNLESYVKADWWRQIFNANYLRTDGDVVEDRALTSREVDLLEQALKPSKDSMILDLCCGQGRHVLELARRGYSRGHGLDRSHYLITRARAINKQEGLNVTFKEGDARKLPFPADTFDCLYIAGNSFGYFESAKDDISVLREVMRVLKPGGRYLIDVSDGDYIRQNFQPRGWEWIDKNYFVCRERSLSADGERLISREVISHVNKGVVADQFYAERLYTRESLLDLLKRAGFSEIEFHGEIVTDSQRNQDLGMMERRVVVSCKAKKEWTRTTPKAKASQTIAVLMGDYRKQDKVKPNANFDEDDFYTINEMKRALAQLQDRRILYFDSHDTMIRDLMRNAGKFDFVFNLCDEGFNNDATKELHVPSLLEMLGIPYTGGTPQCLAYCYDKSLVRGVAMEMEIPVPRATFIKPEDTTFIDLQIEFPVIVKPNFGDSSFGITAASVCGNIEELQYALQLVRDQLGYDKPILVEEYLTGKDVSVGIIGNPPDSYLTLPIIQEDYSALPEGLPRICGYEAKWDPDSPYSKITSIPAGLPEATERFLTASCLKLFERLECRDYARFDWRLDDNKTPRLLEVNPNPGWCWDGHLAKMAALDGVNYSQMLDMILRAAEERIRREQQSGALGNGKEKIAVQQQAVAVKALSIETD